MPEPDFAKIDNTTEEDIRRYQIEDGEDPDEDDSLRVYVSPREVRKRFGMSQPQFADLIGVPIGTLRGWEQSRITMGPTALALFRILAREPEAARRALAA